MAPLRRQRHRRALALELADSDGTLILSVAGLWAAATSVFASWVCATAAAAEIMFVAAAASFIDDRVTADLGVDAARDRYLVEIDLGPAATSGELSLVLADLEALSSAAAVWAAVERDLDGDETDDPGSTIVAAPPRTALGDDRPTIEWLQYRNPHRIRRRRSGLRVHLTAETGPRLGP